MSNPQEFTKLCNFLFAAHFGTNYIPIDGMQADGGNDGYLQSEGRLFAMYCPAKPATITNAKYIEKIRSDLAKAKRLSESGKYKIKMWTFVTPRKLANDVAAF